MNATKASEKPSFYTLRTIKWDDEKGCVTLIDQTLLPDRLEYRDCRTVEELAEAISTMRIRGAPAIGVAGAMGVALSAQKSNARTKAGLLHDLEPDAALLREVRPTAVNLSWGVDEVVRFVEEKLPSDLSIVDYRSRIVEHVKSLADRDVEANRSLAELGQKLLPKKASVMTHCKCSEESSSNSRLRARSRRWATAPLLGY
jgi:methylthioribose-1-phosphate isomerase